MLILLYSALVHSVSYIDFAIWGAIPVGTLMAFLSISIGLLNAGSMSH